MRSTSHGRARSRVALVIGGAALATVLAAVFPALAKLEVWREESATAFRKGKRERVVVTDGGRVRLGRSIKSLGQIPASRVWDLARDSKGTLFAATGDEGKVFRLPAGSSDWSLAHDAGDTQALALVATKDGHVFLGTGPSGTVVDLSGDKATPEVLDPAVKYVWDLAADPQGNVYAATGPTGQLWKRSTEGKWSVLLDSKHPHLLAVAVAPDGATYVGSDGEGILYRVDPRGKATVVYDAPQSEIRTILVGSDGSIYAGTASESGGGSSRSGIGFSGSTTATAGSGGGLPGRDGGSGTAASATPAFQKSDDTPKKGEVPTRSSGAPGGTAAPKPASPGENAVYRVDREGVVREIFRARVMIFALAIDGDRLLVGTGPDGQLFEARERDRETTPLARLDHGHVLCLLGGEGGSLLMGTADPGAVVALGSGFVPSGTLTSEPRDTKLLSRFGALTWRSQIPKGTSIRLQARTGNVAEPDETWSDWSSEQSDPASGRAGVPPGRFVQYRATLATSDPTATPELQEVALRYQTANLAPEITKIDVPDVSSADGATRQTRLTIRWDATDPNDDELRYHVHVKKDGWPDWLRLTTEPITDKSLGWDTTAMPAGVYRARIVADDRLSNNPDRALQTERVSETLIVDHQPPAVEIQVSGRKAKVVARDSLTRIAKASYAIDGGEWMPVFAEDGLFDSGTESLAIDLGHLAKGSHVVVVRATDAAGNVGTGDLLFALD